MKTELGVKKTASDYLPPLKADRKNNQLTKKQRAEKNMEDEIRLKARSVSLSKPLVLIKLKLSSKIPLKLGLDLSFS